MVTLQNWFKEQWIKNVSKDAFVGWCSVNKPEYSAQEAAWIYESHVPAKEEKIPAPTKSTKTKPQVDPE